MDKISRSWRHATVFGIAAICTLAALGLTYFLPVFRGIPWALPFLAVVVVAWIGGAAPAVGVIIASSVCIDWLVLASAGSHSRSPIALFRAVAFVLISLLVTYLVRHRHRAASSLQSSEMHYRSMTESASDVVVTINSASVILAINPAVRTVFGYEPEELVGELMTVLMPERFRASHLAGISRHLAGGARLIPWTGVQLPGLRKDGQEIPLEISFSVYVSNGEVRFTGFIRDISDRQKTHAALMQSEKLAAVGRLASSIAHEINNPLEAVTNLLYLARGGSDVAEMQHYLELAEQELRRVSVITSQTLQFHKQSSSPAQVNCNELLDSSLALFQGKLANSQIVLEQRRGARRTAYCVGGEIRQVLNNLIGNAIDATPRGGQIAVRSRDGIDTKSGRPGVLLTIADMGSGISPHVQSRMFEPFFTTKAETGSGLGLWICSHLIAKNGGVLQVRSGQRPGKSGTVFTLFLPDSETEAETGNS